MVKKFANSTSKKPDTFKWFVQEALLSYIRCATYGKSIETFFGISVEAILRILSLWFTYQPVYPDIIEKGLDEARCAVPLESWLYVIPQLMARVQSSSPGSSVLKPRLTSLLCEIAAKHPHALVYPISSAITSSFTTEETADISRHMKSRYPRLVRNDDR